jgi:hypothetical protein
VRTCRLWPRPGTKFDFKPTAPAGDLAKGAGADAGLFLDGAGRELAPLDTTPNLDKNRLNQSNDLINLCDRLNNAVFDHGSG